MGRKRKKQNAGKPPAGRPRVATDSGAKSGAEEPAGDARALRAVVLPVWAVAFALFVAGVYVYAAYGEAWVNSLDDRIAEVVAARAKSEAEAGNTDEAITLYRQACGLPFDSEEQKVWVRRRFGRLLLDTGAYGEAGAVAADMLRANVPNVSHWTAPNLFNRVVKPLVEREDGATLLEVSREWESAAKRVGNAGEQARGALYRSKALKMQRQWEAAFEALQESYRLAPDGRRALQVARTAASMDRPREAREWARIAEEAGGAVRAEAQDLLRELDAAQGAQP